MVVQMTFDNGRGLVRGDAFTYTVIVKGLRDAVAVSRARLTVKSSLAAADPGTFQKTITTTPGADGSVSDAGTTTGVAVLAFAISSTDTLTLTADTQYFWDCQVVLSDGSILTLYKGTLMAVEEVTKTNT